MKPYRHVTVLAALSRSPMFLPDIRICVSRAGAQVIRQIDVVDQREAALTIVDVCTSAMPSMS